MAQQSLRSVPTLLLPLLLLLALGLSTDAFNYDEPVYKWSPLWFNRYYGRGHTIYKRFREEDPDLRWNVEGYSGFPGYLYNKRAPGGRGRCLKENALCSFRPESGMLVFLRCCGALRCARTEAEYVCTNERSLMEDNEADYYVE